MSKLRQKLEYVALAGLQKIFWLVPFRLQSLLGAGILGGLITLLPMSRKRIDNNLAYIMPDMPAPERRQLRRRIASNIGRTYAELLDSRGLGSVVANAQVSGEGLDALRRAKAVGKGAIIVSGHFGQWEAIRAYLKLNGMEAGALYRPQNNVGVDRLQRGQLPIWGQPIFEKGRKGALGMARHIQHGGFMCLMIDQKYPMGIVQNFMGKPATVSTGAADLALKFDVPLIPAFAIRKNGALILEFDAPISNDDPALMTEKLQQALAARIEKYPEQWYWVHKRWQVSKAGLKAFMEQKTP